MSSTFFQSSVVGGLRFLVYFRCVGDLRVECVDLPLVGSDLVCGHRFALHDFLFQRCVVFRRRHRVLICFDLRGERVEFLFVLALLAASRALKSARGSPFISASRSANRACISVRSMLSPTRAKRAARRPFPIDASIEIHRVGQHSEYVVVYPFRNDFVVCRLGSDLHAIDGKRTFVSDESQVGRSARFAPYLAICAS